jgi:hypothetical protein
MKAFARSASWSWPESAHVRLTWGAGFGVFLGVYVINPHWEPQITYFFEWAEAAWFRGMPRAIASGLAVGTGVMLGMSLVEVFGRVRGKLRSISTPRAVGSRACSTTY